MKQSTKLIFGILTNGASVDGLREAASPYEQYLFELWIVDGKYKFVVETLIGFTNANGCVDYMNSILKEVEKWMKSHSFDTRKELDVYEVFTTGLNANSQMDTVEDSYALLKLLVRGFRGKGVL